MTNPASPSRRKAIIFGASVLGRRYYPFISKDYDVVAYSDNRQDLVNTYIDCLPVVPPAEMRTLLGNDGLVIVCTRSRFFDELVEQISSYGLKSAICLGGVVVDKRHPDFLATLYKSMSVEPHVLQVNLTDRCNLRCRYCICQSETSELAEAIRAKGDNITWPVINSIASQAQKIESLTEIQLCGYGEPMLHPEWLEMTTHILNNTTIKTVVLNTNGMTLTKKNVEKIAKIPCERMELIISVDGASPQETEYWRKGSDYSVIRENLLYAHESLDQEKVNFSVHKTCVLPATMTNQTKYREVKAYLDASGDYIKNDFPFAKVWSHEAYYFGYNVSGTKRIFVEDQEALMLCTRRFKYLSVLVSGDIVGCGCDSDVWILGNVQNDNMYEVWLNDNRMVRRREEYMVGEINCRCLAYTKDLKHYFLAYES